MAGKGARERRRYRKAEEVGPSKKVISVDILTREETLECGHAKTFPTINGHLPPKYRRCVECNKFSFQDIFELFIRAAIIQAAVNGRLEILGSGTILILPAKENRLAWN